jgi:hypothetical protein
MLRPSLPVVVNSKRVSHQPRKTQSVKVELAYLGQILRLYDTLKRPVGKPV